MIEVRCRCGHSFEASDRLAGHDVDCPRCGKACLVAADLALGAAGADPAIIDFQDSGDDMAAAIARPVIPVLTAIPYARDAVVSSAAEGPVASIRRTSFSHDLLWSVWYPFRDQNNAITMGIIVFACALSHSISRFGIGGLLGYFIILAWLTSIFMNVVSETCAGSDDLPSLTMEGGFYDDIVKPFFLFIATVLLALLPLIAGTMLMKVIYSPPAPWNEMLRTTWLAAGVLLWPMILLLTSVGAPGYLGRLDLVTLTIVRTLPGYFFVGVLLMVACAFYLLTLATAGFAFVGTMLGWGIGPMSRAGAICVNVVAAYFVIVAMRCLGLFYRHHRRHFALRFE
ncbi:MAG: hypothetical protein L6Q92_00820 [Phycisphaerae bacterium]|nr:hypothetical protein [Phycisphaerae bacterium]